MLVTSFLQPNKYIVLHGITAFGTTLITEKISRFWIANNSMQNMLFKYDLNLAYENAAPDVIFEALKPQLFFFNWNAFCIYMTAFWRNASLNRTNEINRWETSRHVEWKLNIWRMNNQIIKETDVFTMFTILIQCKNFREISSLEWVYRLHYLR